MGNDVFLLVRDSVSPSFRGGGGGRGNVER